MNKKVIISILGILVIGVGIFYLLYPKFYHNQSIDPKVDSKKAYSTLEEYAASIDYSCNIDSDCEIKDVHNCCGAYPECVNLNSKVDSDFVNKACSKESMSGICGFDSIDSCRCVNKKCQGYLKE